jgi:hypothetical protein
MEILQTNKKNKEEEEEKWCRQFSTAGWLRVRVAALPIGFQINKESNIYKVKENKWFIVSDPDGCKILVRDIYRIVIVYQI